MHEYCAIVCEFFFGLLYVLFLLFTCVSYAEACNRYSLSVRLSVRHKRLNILSCFLRHTIAHSF